jgi:hypothetical protein
VSVRERDSKHAVVGFGLFGYMIDYSSNILLASSHSTGGAMHASFCFDLSFFVITLHYSALRSLHCRLTALRAFTSGCTVRTPCVVNGGGPNHPLEGGPIPRNTHSFCSGQLYNF